MLSAKADLAIYQGDDYAAEVTVRDAAKVPVDITGYTAQAQIRRKTADDDEIVVATFAATVVTTKVFLALTHTQTTSLKGRYVWDLQIISPGGAITTILEGSVIVTAEVTRAA